MFYCTDTKGLQLLKLNMTYVGAAVNWSLSIYIQVQPCAI